MSLKSEFRKLKNHTKACFSLESLKNPDEPSISANIICKNNINSIEMCLKSLKDVVDEIVVVDGGSTDGTVEILEKYNCKIMMNKDWQGYSYQRNLAIKHSKGDWILKLDSDEVLSPELQKNLRFLCQSKYYSAYKTFSRWLQKLPQDLDKEALSYIAKSKYKGRYKSILRLCRNLPEIEFTGDVHEYITGLEGLRAKKLSTESNYIYHLDTAINSFESRFDKVQAREKVLKGSGHPEEYLPELHEIDTQTVPEQDQEYLTQLLRIKTVAAGTITS